jgi:hypothetical protein
VKEAKYALAALLILGTCAITAMCAVVGIGSVLPGSSNSEKRQACRAFAQLQTEVNALIDSQNNAWEHTFGADEGLSAEECSNAWRAVAAEASRLESESRRQVVSPQFQPTMDLLTEALQSTALSASSYAADCATEEMSAAGIVGAMAIDDASKKLDRFIREATRLCGN